MGKVTLFLCSPPRGLKEEEEELLALQSQLRRQNTEIDFVFLLPDTYSPTFDRFPASDDEEEGRAPRFSFGRILQLFARAKPKIPRCTDPTSKFSGRFSSWT